MLNIFQDRRPQWSMPRYVNLITDMCLVKQVELEVDLISN